MTRTVAYLRVSTDKQADAGVSLAAQRAKAKAYAELYGLELVAVLVDAGASAKTLDRPALSRALAMLKAGEADAMLVVKLDRLTRSVRDLGTLLDRYFGERKGAALMSVSEQIDTRSAGGRLVLNVLMSVAQWEREAIGERTRSAMQHKKANGELVGAVPYGYQLDADGVHLVEHEGEQRVLASARRLRAAGLSLRAVSAELDRAGFQSRKGRRFGAQSIANMLAA